MMDFWVLKDASYILTIIRMQPERLVISVTGLDLEKNMVYFISYSPLHNTSSLSTGMKNVYLFITWAPGMLLGNSGEKASKV